MNKGIAILGNVLVDRINEIAKYPESGELTKILSVKLATGGCVPNVAIDLKRLEPTLPVYAVSRVGDDGDGKFATRVLSENGVDTTGILVTEGVTSFTAVMSEVGGQRTFFTHLGCAAEFGYDDVDFDSLECDMLHLGYYLLLDKIDAGDGERRLREATSRGIKTSIDLVSENSDRYRLVIPSLKYTDNLIVNEIEAGKLAGITPTATNLAEIGEKLLSLGVRERVIIHERDRGIVVTREGVTSLGSYILPEGFIKGTTGAGDAFCAGALLAIYEGKSDLEILESATLAALGALREADAIGGMRERCELKKLTEGLERIKIC